MTVHSTSQDDKISSAKRNSFVNLAEKRTRKVLDSIDSLSNLSNSSNYEYTESDYRQIISAIRSSVNKMQEKFERNGKSKTSTFTLKNK